MTETGAIIAFLAFIFFYLAALGLGVANYIIHSLSLYRIAKQRCLANPWLAWIPIAYDWTIGSIVDDFDSETGIDKKWRKALITMSLIMLVAIIVVYFFMFAYIIVSAFVGIGSGNEFAESDAITLFIIFYVAFLAIMVVAVALQIARYICYYKIFEAIRPEKSVKYLLLSAMVPLALPICLMKCNELCPPKYQPYVADDADFYTPEDNGQAQNATEREEVNVEE